MMLLGSLVRYQIYIVLHGSIILDFNIIEQLLDAFSVFVLIAGRLQVGRLARLEKTLASLQFYEPQTNLMDSLLVW